jgi:hypothetical protein
VGTIVEELERRSWRRLLTSPTRALWTARETCSSDDLIKSDAISRTRMAGSNLAVSEMMGCNPNVWISAPSSSLESQILRMILSKLRRTSAFLVRSFCAVRRKRSGCMRELAMGGLRRRSFCRGSRKFSKLSALLWLKQLIIAWEKLSSLRRCSSTFAVSSCNLVIVSWACV